MYKIVMVALPFSVLRIVAKENVMKFDLDFALNSRKLLVFVTPLQWRRRFKSWLSKQSPSTWLKHWTVTKKAWQIFSKIVVAVVVISVLAVLFALLFMYVSTGSAFNQWMLNHGATDTDWLWFKSDSKGLEDLRKKAN